MAAMHEDGTLTELSEQWYDGIDVTQVVGVLREEGHDD